MNKPTQTETANALCELFGQFNNRQHDERVELATKLRELSENIAWQERRVVFAFERMKQAHSVLSLTDTADGNYERNKNVYSEYAIWLRVECQTLQELKEERARVDVRYTRTYRAFDEALEAMY